MAKMGWRRCGMLSNGQWARAAGSSSRPPIVVTGRSARRTSTQTRTKYAPVDWSYFISEKGLRWQPDGIRGLFPLEKVPGIISLLAGKPNPETFPIAKLSIDLKPLDGAALTTLSLSGDKLASALQYGPTAGMGDLRGWMESFQARRHSRINDGSWQLSVGNGSQDLLAKAMFNLVNEGDSVLIETPVYTGVVGMLDPMNAHKVEVPSDTDGMNPKALEAILSTWHSERRDQPFPKVLYTCPTGGNPSGASTSLSRKKEILDLARQYNLLILEDDAYHFIHFDPANQGASYFELDGADGPGGRVVRFDSFSKIMSARPGMRIGFMSASKELSEIVDYQTASTNLQPNSTAQAIAHAILEHWGYEGFIAHTQRVANFYKAKRDIVECAAHKHLDGLATWVSPLAGMFLYLNLRLTNDPNSPGDSNEFQLNTALKKGVLGVPGVAFEPNRKKTNYLRCSYSMATEEAADEAFRRLREAILEARGESP